MTRMTILTALAAAPLLAGCNAFATAAGSDAPARAASGAFTCEIAGTGGTYEAVVTADRAVAGEYRFELRGSGGGNSTTIDQGGPFEAAAGERVTLGSARVGGNPSVHLEVTVDGETVECGQRA